MLYKTLLVTLVYTTLSLGDQEGSEWNATQEPAEAIEDKASSSGSQRDGQRPHLCTEHNTSHTRRHHRPSGPSRVHTRRNRQLPKSSKLATEIIEIYTVNEIYTVIVSF